MMELEFREARLLNIVAAVDWNILGGLLQQSMS
jgi:hypothetical protein